MFRWIALTLVMMLMGCQIHATSPTCTVTAPNPNPCKRVTALWIDPRFSDRQVKAIDAAADAWSRSTPECWRRVDRKSTADVEIVWVLNQEGITDPHPINTVGLWAPSHHTIWLTEENLTMTEFRTVSVHELGHYLGLDHSNWSAGTSVMAPTVQTEYPMRPDSDIPEVDVWAYQGVQHVNGLMGASDD